jgi:hypothetical protein
MALWRCPEGYFHTLRRAARSKGPGQIIYTISHEPGAPGQAWKTTHTPSPSMLRGDAPPLSCPPLPFHVFQKVGGRTVAKPSRSAIACYIASVFWVISSASALIRSWAQLREGEGFIDLSSPHLDLPRDSPAQVYSLLFIFYLHFPALPSLFEDKFRLVGQLFVFFPFCGRTSVPLTGDTTEPVFFQIWHTLKHRIASLSDHSITHLPRPSGTICYRGLLSSQLALAINRTIEVVGVCLRRPLDLFLLVMNLRVKW